MVKKKAEKKTEQEKVDERREEVLSKGRRFKYPLQWTRHRIIINTLLITVVLVAVIILGGWLALYRFGMTSELLFRVTKIVPVPVAVVDSRKVLFSDYLMLYRSSMTSIERQSGSQFDQASLDDLRAKYKRSALSEAEKYTFALKLAAELGITVSKEEIANEFERHLSIGGVERSEEGLVKIIENNFGLTKSEYERMLYLTLIKAKVEIALDESANRIADQVETLLSANDYDYQVVVDQLGEAIIYQETGNLVDSKNIDGGRASEAMKLEPGQSSGKFISMNGDGYYFVKLINKTDTEANFISIQIPFTEFNRRFDQLQNQNQITEYIEIKDPDNSVPESSN